MRAQDTPPSEQKQDRFERLVREHKDAVYRQMVRACGNFDDAEDVLSEALLRAYRASDQLRDSESFRAWVAMIGRRVCGKLRKKEALLPVVELVETHGPIAEGPQAELMMQETKSCILNALASLPEEYRRVYELREIKQVPGEDVARQLGISLPAMKSRLHRARAMIRQQLDEAMCEAP